MAQEESNIRVKDCLTVKLIEAKDLPKMDIGGLSDPYCDIKVNNQLMYKTQIKFNTLEPFWGETFEIDIDDAFQEVSVTVWDYDTISKDDLIGKITLPQSQLADGKIHEQWWPLYPGDEERQGITGQLLLEILHQPSTDAKKDGHIFIHVVEGRSLAPKDSNGLSDPFCTIKFGDAKAKTKVHKKTLNPVFDEKFCFEIPKNSKANELVFLLSDKDLIGSDFMGRVVIPLENLEPDEPLRDWFMVCPLLRGKKSAKADGAGLGSVRMKVHYFREEILPLEQYMPFVDHLLQPASPSLPALFQAVTDRDAPALCLMRLLVSINKSAAFACSTNSQEVQAHTDPHTIFRGNSIATKCIDALMKVVGGPYLAGVLTAPLKAVLQLKAPFELDPARLLGKSAGQADANLAVLLEHFTAITTAIFGSVAHFPPVLAAVFASLTADVKDRFPADDVVPYTAVSGFIFLRFFCPCILNPKLFDLYDKHPDEVQARNLTLLSKCVQTLANLAEFGDKEPYMACVNATILGLRDKLKAFITAVAQPCEPGSECPAGVAIDPAREACRLHLHFVNSRAKLQSLIQMNKAPSLTDLSTHLARITQAVDDQLGSSTHPHELVRQSSSFSSLVTDVMDEDVAWLVKGLRCHTVKKKTLKKFKPVTLRLTPLTDCLVATFCVDNAEGTKKAVEVKVDTIKNIEFRPGEDCHIVCLQFTDQEDVLFGTITRKECNRVVAAVRSLLPRAASD